jgi:hypothetical protein
METIRVINARQGGPVAIKGMTIPVLRRGTSAVEAFGVPRDQFVVAKLKPVVLQICIVVVQNVVIKVIFVATATVAKITGINNRVNFKNSHQV